MATKKNRAQRRHDQFGGGRTDVRTTNPTDWPTTQPNPAFGADPTDKAVAGRPDQDQTEQTGAGTGGATEQAGRVPRHAGTHATNSAKG